MRAEWRANLWMALELLIVSVVLFVLADKVYTSIATISEPLGFNSEHVYRLNFAQLSKAAPDYKEKTDDEFKADRALLIDRLRARPEIEAVSLAINAHPYNPSNNMGMVVVDTISVGGIMKREVDGDFFKVFRIRGAHGESPERLAELLEEQGVLVSDNLLYRRKGIKSMDAMRGKQLILNESDTLTVGTAFFPMKYGDYQTVYGGVGNSFFQYLRPDAYWANELTVRVRDNMDRDFVENIMKDADGPLRVGNFYIGSVTSFDFMKENHNRQAKAEMRNTIVCAVFLLINIFLGIFGTFWFRTQQRAPEIALRMVNGATRADIFRRILGEGQLILLAVTPLAVAADWLLTKYEFTTWYDGWFHLPHFLTSVVAAWALMALMIAVGTALPALRAMKVSPASALKSE